MRFNIPRVASGIGIAALACAAVSGGEAKAILSCTFGNLSTCNGTEGNLQISNFQLGGGSTGFQNSDQIFILQTPGTTNYQIIGQYTDLPTDSTQLTGNGSFSFTASALNGLYLNAASVDAQTTPGTFTFTTSLTSFPGSPLVSVGGTPLGPTSPPNNTVTTSDIVIAWAANGGTATNSLLNLDVNANNVPAPLPILGAATAFSFSRRMRRRIKARA